VFPFRYELNSYVLHKFSPKNFNICVNVVDDTLIIFIIIIYSCVTEWYL
jgi:hypothetical protein